MPYFELHLFSPGSIQPFASLSRSTSPLGSFNVGESITLGARSELAIVRVAHRCLPGPNNETLIQTALVVSAPGAGLVAESIAEPWSLASGDDFVPWPVLGEAVLEGVAPTLQEALGLAHAQVPQRPHRDFTVSKVVEWGMQRGGYTDQTRFYVRVVEDPNAHLRSDGPESKQTGLLGGDFVGNG